MIPLTPQTDPKAFPPYEFRPYPRMMHQKASDPKLRGKLLPMLATPDDVANEFAIVEGAAIVVNNEVEEAAWRAAHPETAPNESEATKGLTRTERQELEEFRASRGVKPVAEVTAKASKDKDTSPVAKLRKRAAETTQA